MVLAALIDQTLLLTVHCIFLILILNKDAIFSDEARVFRCQRSQELIFLHYQ